VISAHPAHHAAAFPNPHKRSCVPSLQRIIGSAAAPLTLDLRANKLTSDAKQQLDHHCSRSGTHAAASVALVGL
jgi:hypothetical protein